MDIKVGLVTFTNHGSNINTLLEKKGNIYAIPERTLPEWRDSLYIVRELLESTMGITGSWAEIELGLRQSGVYDDVGRNPDHREILIVYSLFIPLQTRARGGYEWVNICEFPKMKFSLDHENIIRYVGANHGEKPGCKI